MVTNTVYNKTNMNEVRPTSQYKNCSRFDILKWVLNIIRCFYIGAAIYFVCFGYYTTVMMAKEGYRNVQEEVNVFQKLRYPSITFCYVFKDSDEGMQTRTKYVWTLYYRYLVKTWKKSGKECFVIYII